MLILSWQVVMERKVVAPCLCKKKCSELFASSAPHPFFENASFSFELHPLQTDFENAAFTVFIVLVTRVILTLDLNLYMPISKV